MALYDKRHIIEIPFSVIKYNSEFENIMSLTNINGKPINKNNIIIYFDEIDVGFSNISPRIINSENNNNVDEIKYTNFVFNLPNIITDFQPNTENHTNTNVNNNEIIDTTKSKIDIGVILSNLDGVGNYNGLIIVATTNYIDKIDKSLYRDMRLTATEFKPLRKIDCENIIQKFFGNIEQKYKDIIPDRKIIPSTLINLSCSYNHLNIEDFFENVLQKYFI